MKKPIWKQVKTAQNTIKKTYPKAICKKKGDLYAVFIDEKMEEFLCSAPSSVMAWVYSANKVKEEEKIPEPKELKGGKGLDNPPPHKQAVNPTLYGGEIQ